MTQSPVVHATAVYTLETARQLLGLTKTTLPREIRLGRLRVSRRGGKYFLLGSWLLSWLEDGQVVRQQHAGDLEADEPSESKTSAPAA